MEKNKISWSYSNYMAALEKEDILNNTDESTFGSLLNFGESNILFRLHLLQIDLKLFYE